MLGFVQDENKNRSELYIIDAKKFSLGPIAKIAMEHRVHYGFHGLWIADAEIAV